MGKERDLRVLLLSVGGSPAPLVESISRQRPDRLIFFASAETEGSIDRDVLSRLPADYRYLGLERIVTPSSQLLDECYRILRERVPVILNTWGMTPSELRADFTGGTKVMSAAVVLALAGMGGDFSYVGAQDQMARDKGGVGVVLDGRESLFLQADPWQQIVADKVSASARLFSQGRYELAFRELPAEPEPSRLGVLARSVCGLFEGFFLWDRFKYRESCELLEQHIDPFRQFAQGSNEARYLAFLDQVESCLPVLRQINKELTRFLAFEKKGGKVMFEGVDGWALVADLCAAAVRRARQEDDAEDGVMLLYAALEKAARGRLLAGYGIDNSRSPVERLGALQKDVLDKQHPKDGVVHLALRDSFRLLAELGDELGRRFLDHEDVLNNLMTQRNFCWREHGYRGVTREQFEDRLAETLGFLGLAETDLIRFPRPEGW